MVLNLLKSVLNNFDIADVHIHEIFLLLVVGFPLGETGLEKGGGVQKLGGLSFLVLIVTNSFGVVALLLGIIAFTELGLEGLNFFLKVQLVRLVLLLESQDLVVGLLADALTLVG